MNYAVLCNKAVSIIPKLKKKEEQSKLIKDLFIAAEQRINFLYFMLIIAFGVALLIYVLINDWDNTRYYFGIRAGLALLLGIFVNTFAIIIKKSYFWIKYINNAVIIVSLYYLCGLSDLIAMLFILLPFINSFYFRPVFTAITGLICSFMMYICFLGALTLMFDSKGNITYNFFSFVESAFDFSNKSVILLNQNRSLLIIIALSMVVVSVYLSANSRKFAIKQGELTQKNLATETELNVARSIQEGILSSDFPDTDSFAVYAKMKAATEVGGDFFDWFFTDETHLAVVIGDVSGHGMAAAMFMTLSKTLIKIYAQAHYSTDKVFELTNRFLQQSNPTKFFVTCWIGILDLSTGVLTYTNAGHNYPVIVSAGKKPEFLRSKPNFVLGRRRFIRYNEKRMKLQPGDKLILYTDGVTEAQASDESFFGNDRLLEVMAETANQDQKEIIMTLRKAIDAFESGNEQYDDETVLSLYFKDYLVPEPPESKSFFLTEETFDEVTKYIAEQCRKSGCDDNTVSQIIIASSEILANIDSYVYENGGEIEVLTKCRDRRMIVVFKDNGTPFNPLLVQEPDITLPLKNRKPGGLGIFIVKKLMSDISYKYEGGKNVLTIEIDF